MIAAYFVNQKGKLLMWIMSTGKENAMAEKGNELSKKIIKKTI